ncbi:G protein beta subunit, partial [Reticulomyxa filosa]
ELYRELEKHDGYLSCARFIDDTEIVSASGDGTCILWDVDNKGPKSIYADHTADVMSVSLNKKSSNLFVSGSIDTTAKVWDTRQGDHAVATFTGHGADVNRFVFIDSHFYYFPFFCFFENQRVFNNFDFVVYIFFRLFDMRSYRQLNQYVNKSNVSLHSEDLSGVTSIDVSKSGHYIFAAYDNGRVYMWSTLQGQYLCELPHESR